MKKKLLMLGGADIQVNAIKAAQKLGYYVITSDFKEENPGHSIADETYNISTTLLEEIYQLSKELKINGISAYASDPGALTAAFVGEKLSIPSNPFYSIKLLSNKLSFRKTQEDIGVPFPLFLEVKNGDDIKRFVSKERKKFIVKPVDSSGSKGVSIIGINNLNEAEAIYRNAVSFSRIDQVIIEEYIQRKGFLMSGDVLMENGKTVFHCFGDVHFNDSINGLVPRSISLPSSNSDLFFGQVSKDLNKIFAKLEITMGTFNVDVIECKDGRPMIIDIGARNGGNMFNDIIHLHTGYDLISASLQQCMGDSILSADHLQKGTCYSHYVIHSKHSGLFEGIEFSNRLRKKIIYQSELLVKPGDRIRKFIDSSCRIGLLLVRYDSFEEMHELLGADMKNDIFIYLKEDLIA